MPPAGPGRSLILKQTGEMNDYANNPARKGGVLFAFDFKIFLFAFQKNFYYLNIFFQFLLFPFHKRHK